ncbi:hypothetical protein B0H10DRAFT_2445458 [Mycena sp. CBHHK59/15]|nr:hypothetical protein B0H10DRAFT_2445458 [Mycena sp. CBHHK59/15]
MYYLNNISLMLAEPKLATLPWSADNGALTWTLLEHLQKKENFVVLFGKQDPNAVVVVDRGKEDVAESHLVLRARHFLDSWSSFLDISGYNKSLNFLSREAVDIARIIIEGYLALVQCWT